MNWHWTPYAWFPFLAGCISLAMACYAWRQRRLSGAIPFAFMALAAAVWSLGYVLEMISGTLEAKLFWDNVQFMGMVLLPPTFVAFVLYLSGQQLHWQRPLGAVMALEPLVMALVVWTDRWHHLVRPAAWLGASGPFPALVFRFGPAFLLHGAYAYALLSLGILLLWRSERKAQGLYRRQMRLLLWGALLPWAGSVFSMLDISLVEHLDASPTLFALSSIAFSWSLSRHRLLDIVPIARDNVVEHMAEALIVLDLQGRIVDLNAAARRFLGHSGNEALGQPVCQALAIWPGLAAFCGQQEETHAEFQLAGTEPAILDARLSPLYSSRGQQIGQLLVLSDMTARKRLEEALRASEHKYRTVVESANDGIIIGQGGSIRYANPQVSALTGYALEEIIGQPFVRFLAPEERERIEEAYAAFLQSAGAAPRYEAVLLHKDGRRIPTEISAAQIEYEGSRAFLAFVRDITERRQAEEALQQSNEELRARNEELDAFSHTVAHDLKNPLNNIIGFTEVMYDDYDTMADARRREFLRFVVESARKMANIIEELMLLAGLRSQEIEPRPVHMGRVVAEARNRLSLMLVASRAEISAPAHWPVALGYAPWLEEVWVNYLSNAVKYGGQPPKIELGATVQEDGRVRFWVRDHGPGIAPEMRAQLFTPFARITQIRAEGQGLGLSIVRRIIEKLGGEVGAEGAAGQGSIFYFILPAAE